MSLWGSTTLALFGPVKVKSRTTSVRALHEQAKAFRKSSYFPGWATNASPLATLNGWLACWLLDWLVLGPILDSILCELHAQDTISHLTCQFQNRYFLVVFFSRMFLLISFLDCCLFFHLTSYIHTNKQTPVSNEPTCFSLPSHHFHFRART